MYVRKRIGRRRSYFLKYRIPLFVFLCAAICLLGFLLKPSSRIPISTNSPVALEMKDSERSPEPSEPVKYGRPVYPYSVIPGGVRSRAELTSSIKEDPVIASHYAKFEVAEARFIKSEETQSVHVSYRMGDKIFWTAKTVAIPKGETLVTDGSSTARTRCGNQVSVLPQEPISPEEPPIETFDIPVFETPLIARFEPPNLDFSRQPELGLDINPTQPVIPYVPIRPPALDNLRQSAVRPLALFPRSSEVPEPGTMSLTILGLITFAALRFSRKK
jgi:hypothetical protein